MCVTLHQNQTMNGFIIGFIMVIPDYSWVSKWHGRWLISDQVHCTGKREREIYWCEKLSPCKSVHLVRPLLPKGYHAVRLRNLFLLTRPLRMISKLQWRSITHTASIKLIMHDKGCSHNWMQIFSYISKWKIDHRPYSERFCDVARKSKFTLKCDVAKSAVNNV